MKGVIKMTKKTYTQPEMATYSQEELADMIESGACSKGYSCMCHNGDTNANR